ncbi:MAG TPA: Fe-S protein assembly co-chaperone HscB [Rhodocyclaceae bacterium]
MDSLDPQFAGKDHFALFGLPLKYAVDRDALEATFRDLQARVHPDKYAHLGDTERRLAMQWATQVNEAYQTLRDPLKRGRYLLHLAGHDPQIETNTAMPAEFLIEQMELREAVAEAAEVGDVDNLDALHRRMRKEMATQQERLREAIDDRQDWGSAAETVRQLMFQEKLLHDIDAALEATEA